MTPCFASSPFFWGGGGINVLVDRFVGHGGPSSSGGLGHNLYVDILSFELQPIRDLPRSMRRSKVGEGPCVQHDIGRDLARLSAVAWRSAVQSAVTMR